MGIGWFVTNENFQDLSLEAFISYLLSEMDPECLVKMLHAL